MSGRPQRDLASLAFTAKEIVVCLALCGLAAAAGPVRAATTTGSADGPTGSGERAPAVSPIELPEPIVLSPQARELSERYRTVFQTLASGDRATAVRNAAALETQAFASNPRKAIEWLSQADGVLLDTYLQVKPDCALPLVLFYQRLVLAHSAHRSFPLIQRALRVADGIFDRMSRAAKTREERRLTADAYSGFAADLLTVPAPARAADMIGRGLDLAPGDADATVALSILLLRDRRTDAAEARLDQVLSAQPGNREARLRRALLRRGFSADGRTGHELEKLATVGENDWISLVAAQEQVRRLLATAKFNNAIAFLDRVLERFPEDSSLRVALAFATARSGRRAEAYVAAQSAMAAKASTGEGARRIFAELPIRLLRDQAARAAATADARIASLSAAIAGTTPAAPASPDAQPATSPAPGEPSR